jgi:hypothetical protein
MGIGKKAAFVSGPAAGRRRRPSSLRGRWVGLSAALIAVAGVVALTGPGEALASLLCRFLEFYSGVFALVALSLTVMGGFVATDRMVLNARHRVSVQAAHRLTAVLAVSCLAIHITLKVAEGHATVVDVVVPFLSSHQRLFVGLGTIAFYLIGVLIWTGFIRASFAHNPRPWLWRALHVLAYPAWLFSIVHGLGAGRDPAGWVTASYVLCVAAVSLGVLIRIGVARGRRGAGHTTGTVRAVPVAATYAPPPPPTPAPMPVQVLGPARSGAPAARPVVVPAPMPRSAPLAQPPPARVPAQAMPSRQPLPPPGPATPPSRRGGPRKPPPRRKPIEEFSDDEFWERMKGDAVQ